MPTLLAVRIGDSSLLEQIIVCSKDQETLKEAQIWAIENGFYRFRIEAVTITE